MIKGMLFLLFVIGTNAQWCGSSYQQPPPSGTAYYTLPTPQTVYIGTSTGLSSYVFSEVVDINGDGLVDVIQGTLEGSLGSTSCGVMMNNGCGWVSPATLYSEGYCNKTIPRNLAAEVFSEEDLSEYLSISPQATLELLESKAIPALKIEGSWRIHRKAVEKAMGV